jgi:DNA-binding response OmpR family regulator
MFKPQPYIILIDDDEDDLETLSSSLQLAGVRVKTFDSGKKALSYLNLMIEELPSLIILDYNMPRINGQQVLILLKGHHNTMNIPVVMYSTSISLVFKKVLLQLGALDCFVKPTSHSEFKSQVALFKDLASSFSVHRRIPCQPSSIIN